jgi:hypothetical protein
MTNFILTFETYVALAPTILLTAICGLTALSVVITAVFEALRNQPKYQRTYRHFDPSYYRRESRKFRLRPASF